MTPTEQDYTAMDATQLAVERTRLAAERNRLAEERTRLAAARRDYARIRTHLANKRTFLAWSRTALAVMTFGFLLERVDAFIGAHQLTKAMHADLSLLGIAAFVFGPLLMLLGAWRYILQERALGGKGLGDMLIVPELTLFLILVGFTLFHVFA